MYTLKHCVKEKNTYKDIVLVDETGRQYCFKDIVDLKAVKDNYIGDNYYFDAKGAFHPYTKNKDLPNNLNIEPLMGLARDLNTKLNRIENTLSVMQMQMSDNFVSMNDRLSSINKEIQKQGTTFDSYQKDVMQKMRNLFDKDTKNIDFDGKYQFARCKDKMYANEMYTDDIVIDNQLLIDLEKACVGMDNIYSSLYHTLKTDLGEEREDVYSFFNLMNCSEKSLCAAYALDFAKQAMPKLPLLQDLYSIDYKSHSAMENDSRRSGLFTSDARRFVLRKSDNNFYTYFVDITLFLSNMCCFTMAGTSDEKGLVSDYLEHTTEERPYKGYLKGTACNPYQFEDKILIDFYCVAYLYYLKDGNKSVSFTFKYKDTKTGLQSVRALMRNVIVAYFAAKRVYCRCSNTKPEVLNNMLNMTEQNNVVKAFLHYLDGALYVQGVRKNYRDYVTGVMNHLYDK